MPKILKTLLKPLASLRLTVVLLALSMVLILVGTVAQRFDSTWDAQKKYFYSLTCQINGRDFLPVARAGEPRLYPCLRGVHIPMVGGYLLGLLLLVNLLAAHTVRFKLSSKRIGVWLIHIGLIVLLVSQGITSGLSTEGVMVIHEGGYSEYSEDHRSVELAVIDPSDPAHDQVTVIKGSALKPGAVLRDDRLPFSVRVDDFLPNSTLLGPMEADAGKLSPPAGGGWLVNWAWGCWVSAPESRPLVTAGEGLVKHVEPKELNNGSSEEEDQPSAYVTLTADGKGAGEGKGEKNLGTYLVSTCVRMGQAKDGSLFVLGKINDQAVTVGDKTYQVALRFTRHYKPYRIYLKQFHVDYYPGTRTPKNYASDVRLVDEKSHLDRETKVWMNHPMRYWPAGRPNDEETIYQASAFDAHTTGLQIVHNPGWLLPYVACALGAVGMLIHFGMALVTFLGRDAKKNAAAATAASVAAAKAAGAKPGDAGGRGARGGPAGRAPAADYVLRPRRAWSKPAAWFPALVAALAVYTIGMLFVPPGKAADGVDYPAFGRLPVAFEGRVQPMDSMARNLLRYLSERDAIKVDDAKSIPATRWLLEMLTRKEEVANRPVFRIDYPGVVALIGGDPDKKLYSYRDIFGDPEQTRKIEAAFKEVRENANQEDPYQVKVAELENKAHLFTSLLDPGLLQVVPPSKAEGAWRKIGEVVKDLQNGSLRLESPPVAHVEQFLRMLEAYKTDQAPDFNARVAAMSQSLSDLVPGEMRGNAVEVIYNRVSPFLSCAFLYLGAFVLVALSWLFWPKPLFRGGVAVMAVALALHTAALIARMYISGKPAVTNLYSAAVFIAWAAVVMALVLAGLFRKSRPTLTNVAITGASLLGCASLTLAYFLHVSRLGGASDSGDTLPVLRAVLDTPFWLATHVQAITIGYASTFLAGMLAMVYLVLGLFTPALNRDKGKDLARMVYGVVCFSMLFSFVGTILGGIWADQSWGRFWGWDPKENGAALLVAWNAIILHARWGGLVKDRGLMLLAIFGNVVTAWSGLGTNMLDIGLHRYASMNAAAPWLVGYVLFNLAFIGIGLLPLRFWRSPMTSDAGPSAPARRNATSAG